MQKNKKNNDLVWYLAGAVVLVASLISGFFYLTGNFGDNESALANSSPDDPGGLTLWLDAEDLDGDGVAEGALESGLSNGSEIDQWSDKSGNANHVTADVDSQRPNYVLSDQNSLPTVEFVGNDVNGLSTADADQITADGSYTKFAVFKYNSDNFPNNLVSSQENGTLLWGGPIANGAAGVNSGKIRSRNSNFAPGDNLVDYTSSENKLNLNQYYIVANRYDNVGDDAIQSVLNLDGTQIDSDNLVRPHQAARTFIGAHESSTSNIGGVLDGNLAEVMIFDRGLSDREIDTMECYLSEKWGVSVSSTCNAVYVNKEEVNVNEGGQDSSLEIRLNEAPTANVTVNLALPNTDDATLSTASLVFTPTGGSTPWDLPQAITISGIEDGVVSQDTTNITVSVDPSSDVNFVNEDNQTVLVTVLDNDVVNNPPIDFGKLTLWLDASDDATLYSDTDCSTQATIGDSVNCVVDKSGLGNIATNPTGTTLANVSTTGPELISNGSNGLPVLEFKPSNGNYLVTPDEDQITENGSFTKFVVYKFDSLTAKNHLVSSRNNGSALFTNGFNSLYAWNRAIDPDNIAAGAPGYISTPSIDNQTYNIATNRYQNIPNDGEYSVLNINGVEEDSNDQLQNHGDQPTYIGSFGDGNFLDGKIAEVLIYNKALTDQQIDCVEAYLGNKWGVVTNNLISTCTQEESMTLFGGTDYPEYKIFQRDANDQYTFENISGRFSGVCSGIEASFAGRDFQNIDTTVSDGTFSGTLENQSVGQGEILVRCIDNPNIQESFPNIGIGDVFIVAGQSNAEGRGKNKQFYSTVAPTATVFPTVYTERNVQLLRDELKPADDETDPHFLNGGGGSVWPIVGGYIAENAGVPVMFITTADGDKGLVNPAHWTKGGGVNCRVGPTCYENMLNQVNEINSNAIRAVLWYQGEKDAAATSRNDYAAALSQFIEDIRSDVSGDPDLVSGVIGAWNPEPEGATQIRHAQIDSWDNDPNILYGPHGYDIDIIDDGTDTDEIHYQNDDEIQTLGFRWWKALEAHYYGGNGGRGPVLATQEFNREKTKIYLTFDSSSPLSQVNPLDTSAWVVTDGDIYENNGNTISIDTVEVTSDNKVVISLQNAPTTTDVYVSYAVDNLGEGKNVLTDSTTGNTALGVSYLPADPFLNVLVQDIIVDEDGDGVSDEDELNALNNGDANSDGVQDYLQSNVAAYNNSTTGESTTIELLGDCQEITNFGVVQEVSLSVEDLAKDYPLGLLDFDVNCSIPNGQSQVTVIWSKIHDTSKWGYSKFINDKYTDISTLVTHGTREINGQNYSTSSYTLTDGGDLDNDGVVNGKISDPAGPTLPVANKDAIDSLIRTGGYSLISQPKR